MMMLTRALRNDSLSFLGAYDAAPFLPFVPGGGLGDVGKSLPFVASQVLLRMCFGLLPKPTIIKKEIKLSSKSNYSQYSTVQ